jgi:hypothetical protein
MICFDVYLNGEKLCRAGMKDAVVMNCILDWVKLEEGGEEMAFTVGGLYDHPSGGTAHPRWLNRRQLKTGDEVTIRIVDSETADEPVSEKVSTPEWLKEQERKYYESVRAKFEGEQDG